MDMCEFMCEEELIEIIPNFKFPKQLNLISGDFGPFIPQVPTKVPIWLALNLHEQHKCTIMLPKWIKELLELQDLQEYGGTLLKMPCEYWRETLKLLQHHIANFPDCNDIIERREAMLKHSVHGLFRHAAEQDSLVIADVTLGNITKGELFLIKVFVQKTFAHLQELRVTAAQVKAGKS